MTSSRFLTALSRLLNCSKVQVATTGLVSTWFAVRYAAADLPPTQRSALWVAFIGAVTVALREVINAWTEEDVAVLNRRGGTEGRSDGSIEGTKGRSDEGTKGNAEGASVTLVSAPSVPPSLLRPPPSLRPCVPSSLSQ